MDKQIRNKLQKLVSACRSLLNKEFTAQLQMIYGIQPTGRIDELSTLTHLDNEQYRIAALLRDRVNHLSGLLSSGKEALREAVQRLIREQAFTVLNRFVALKMCEEREITQECVKSGYQSKGFQLFLATCGSGIGDSYQRYIVFIKGIFDELSLDLGVLFDRFSPFGLLFPGENALEKLFAELNTPELSDIWKEDETIGWVYQYFNSKEERKAMRKSSSAPRNSRELAVRNQFFTPRYVVQFLTDNTLGRIWYEMTKGNTELKGQCEYLVRRPQEVFLEEGENPPEIAEEEGDKSQEELLKEPEYIPYRKIKDPREIRMLDPACGSMHFGLYAFDLYQTIYEEVWDRYPELLQDIREKVKEKQEFLSIVPELIIRHNIHGIDIDHRAVQIAGLSLWLRAQKSYQRLMIKPEDRPRITRSNVVCAEPMPGEKDYLEEFISRLKPAVLGDLVKDVWEKMQLAGEAGSLLKIEEELTDSIRKAREVWELYKRERGVYAEQDLFDKGNQLSLKEMIGFDISDIESLEEWDQMEAMVLSALKEFAESATGNGGYDRKLFAEDAAQGFAFIDVCRQRYDVVLMNPPFGEIVLKSKEHIRKYYPNSKFNIGCTFVDRILDILKENSYLGTIIDNATSVRSSYSDYRKNVLYKLSTITNYCSLGWGVLDANVETCCYTIKNCKAITDLINCFDMESIKDKAELLHRNIDSIKKMRNAANYFVANQAEFEKFPNAVPSYKLPYPIRNIFSICNKLDPKFAAVCTGVSTGDNERFYKLSWEIPYKFIIDGKWYHLSNGGEFSPFYRIWQEVVEWKDNGKKIKSHPGAYIRNEKIYFKPGLTYGKRNKYLSIQYHPASRIFTNEGQAIFCQNREIEEYILSILNTKLYRVLINEYCGQHKENGYVKLLPIMQPSPDEIRPMSDKSKKIQHIIRSYLSRHIEHSESLGKIFINNDKQITPSLNELIKGNHHHNLLIKNELEMLEEELDNFVFKKYKIDYLTKSYINLKTRDMPKISSLLILQNNYDYVSELIDYLSGTIFNRWDIRIALNPTLAPKLADPFDPLPVCPPGMLVGPDGLPAESGRIVSEEWLRARPNAITLPPEGSVKNPTIPDSGYLIEVAWNGILVDDPSNRDDIIGRMRKSFQVIWQEKADSIEQEACEILDIKDLRDYFRRPAGFFADHLKRYSKSRRQAPIYWPLSTASASYTLWIYYPRLTDQTLYRCVNDYINPKLEHIAREIELQQKEIEKSKAMKTRQELEDLLNMQREIRELKDELLRVAQLPYKPNLNDGVLITASPLYKLFRLAKWRKDLGRCWESLEKGGFDWAHLACSIWPDRVKEKCRKDRSLAIAHDLEDICEVEPKAAKKKPKMTYKKNEEQLGLI